MAHKRADTLVAPKQWWKHLKDYKRPQNKAERRAAKALIESETLVVEEETHDEFMERMLRDSWNE